jgi:hypothetical protein
VTHLCTLDDRVHDLVFDADDVLVMGAYTDEAYTLRAYTDLGDGPTTPRGGVDLLLARVRR